MAQTADEAKARNQYEAERAREAHLPKKGYGTIFEAGTRMDYNAGDPAEEAAIREAQDAMDAIVTERVDKMVSRRPPGAGGDFALYDGTTGERLV